MPDKHTINFFIAAMAKRKMCDHDNNREMLPTVVTLDCECGANWHCDDCKKIVLHSGCGCYDKISESAA